MHVISVSVCACVVRVWCVLFVFVFLLSVVCVGLCACAVRVWCVLSVLVCGDVRGVWSVCGVCVLCECVCVCVRGCKQL